MSEKFPYGYDLNAYIDKAFELLKASDSFYKPTYHSKQNEEDIIYVNSYDTCGLRRWQEVTSGWWSQY